MVRGRGVFVYDERGREYLEGASSFYVAALGYSERELVDVAAEQLAKLPFYVSGNPHSTDRLPRREEPRSSSCTTQEGAHGKHRGTARSRWLDLPDRPIGVQRILSRRMEAEPLRRSR
jgi:hypothetical protein